MKHIILLLTLAACSTIPAPKATDSQWIVPGLTEQKQETDQWCAIAAARMLTKSTIRQCEVASKTFGDDCCTKLTVKCVQPNHIEMVLRAMGEKPVVHAVTFDAVFKLIQAGKPVGIAHYNRQGAAGATAHAVVAFWAYESAGKKYIRVYDPWTGTVKNWDASYVTGNLAWTRVVSL